MAARLRWPGNIEAQRQADVAMLRLKPKRKKKAKKKKRRRRRRPEVIDEVTQRYLDLMEEIL